MKLVVCLLFISLPIVLPKPFLPHPHGGFQRCKRSDDSCNPSNRRSTPGKPENGKALMNIRGELRRDLGEANRKTKKKRPACSRYQGIQLRKKERNFCSNSRRESAMSGKKMCFRINEKTPNRTKQGGYNVLRKSRKGKRRNKKIKRCLKRTTRSNLLFSHFHFAVKVLLS